MRPRKFFTADLHLGHKNILTLTKRKFDSIEEHDAFVIHSINETVDVSDNLYILGDLGFHKDFQSLLNYLTQIKCKNIHVILGNHDNKQHLIQMRREGVIADVQETKTVQQLKRSIVCSHYPMREWHGYYRGYYAAYGHCHGNLPPFERSMDVGIDSIGFNPIEFDDLIGTIERNYRKENSRITSTDEQINKYFPDLSTTYFVNLCTEDKRIRDKIMEVLRDNGN